jgi:molybdenum cofactor cytidylyltransferase
MIVGLLLAAGGARRFRSQKLVAPFRGEPIVLHATRALAAAVDSVIVVVGHEADAVTAAVAPLAPAVVRNPHWELGLATSIVHGVQALPPECEAVVVTVGDQPEIDSQVVRSVVARWRETGDPIVSASYRGVRAHPVLFSREVFGELLMLHGDAGARLMIERNPERVSYVQVDGVVPPDVDTSGELEALERRAFD